MPIGRPSDYTPEIAAAICAGVASGLVLESVLDQIPDAPDIRTVFRWQESNEIFRQDYARAKEAQCEVLAGQIITLSDRPVRAERIKTTDGGIGEDGNPTPGKIEITTGDNVERTKLQMEARRWYLSKVLPKKYGDRLELAGDKDAPLTITVRRRDKE